MDDAYVVGDFKRFGDLYGQRALEGFAFNEFHDNGVGFQAVDGGDVGVVERSQRLGFALEAGGRTLTATSRFSFGSRAR